MARTILSDSAILSIENLHEKFDLCDTAHRYKLDFKEYALLYRVMEGIKFSTIFESLYLSHATIGRCRHTLTKKLNAKTFEQALILTGKLDLICD